MLKNVLLALYYLIESIQAQKYEKKPYFELLYPSPIDVNHGAVACKKTHHLVNLPYKPGISN